MAKKNVVSKAVLRAPRKLAIYLTVGTRSEQTTFVESTTSPEDFIAR